MFSAALATMNKEKTGTKPSQKRNSTTSKSGPGARPRPSVKGLAQSKLVLVKSTKTGDQIS